MNKEAHELSLAPMGESKDYEIQKYLEELSRISTEVEERYRNGYYMQVVSSLAAIPNLHRIIHEECMHASQLGTHSESTETSNDSDNEQEYFGLYL